MPLAVAGRPGKFDQTSFRKNSMQVNKKTSMIVLTFTLIASGMVLNGTANSEPNASAKDSPKPALTVTLIKPQSMTLGKRLQANGSVAAWQEASIGNESNGLKLNQVLVNVGDVVRKGQLLASFATESISADVAAIQASVAEADASLADAKENAMRAKQLQDTGALSQQQINQLLTGEKTATARLLALKAQLRMQQIRLNNTKVLAPDDGVISVRTATVGAVVGAGQELFRLVRKNRIEWRGEVTSNELVLVKQGMDVDVRTGAGDGSVNVKGKVRIVGPTVDPLTRNGIVFVDLPPGSVLKSGMFATGTFDLGSSQALSLPQQSLVVRDGFTYAFTVNTDRAVAIKIKTGRRESDRIEVLEGIKPDMLIIAAGVAFLNNGDLVKVVK